MSTPSCEAHPRYKALRKPRLTCEACWWQWFYAKAARATAAKEAAQAAYDLTPQGQIDKRNREYNKYDDPDSCWYG
jgi:hypothetical protein